MINALVRVMLALIAVLAFLLMVVALLPREDREVQFITSDENCAGHCLIGIVPGTTTVGQVLAHLRAHPWVEEAYLLAPGTGYSEIQWTWSGEQPAAVDADEIGRLTFYWLADRANSAFLNDAPIETVVIYTTLPMPVLIARLGPPDTGTADRRTDFDLTYTAAYRQSGTTLTLSKILPCPVALTAYMQGPTRMAMVVGYGSSPFVELPQLLKQC
ncbi:hypothetical protein G4Y79_07195 [Phototrophicus methaneseepsis]|uniref:Uncharacterized protein n=1 Tax=Phototrophicus methaneseepsis TaxID=2710758 RepID=A0A7S8IG39_9CHLR|nr:hypothetical protein [Phototrophicus methaneseepsis]QPC84149.1 hypothetical protein G4Y79_07195 [Phototrophicus methaneseepsis]